ncbi:hypothetical protein PSI19_04460 [Xenorhabdus khoisanae]|uniref:hypothetical protein n=1 Tax=Xenorhabdus khoisanae TaxID=880157 RepID=UPI002358D686|nr:hypothetical protein [Xenorhabdus khoisanae]MDC9613148.1 hypothetical protein [Xenorhabdus khoisanae]
MSIQMILKDTIAFSRSRFGLKSTNKRYMEPEYLPQSKQNLHSRENYIERMIKLRYLRDALNILSPEKKYKAILQKEPNQLIGNCEEYSLMAFFYLMEEKSKDILINLSSSYFIEYIVTLNSYHHCFIAIEPMKDPLYRQERESLSPGKPLAPNSWICDPWANIACPAVYYPLEWKLKMQKWNDRKKYIRRFTDQFIPPTDNCTYFLIENSVQTIVLLAQITLKKEPETPKENLSSVFSSLSKNGLWP